MESKSKNDYAVKSQNSKNSANQTIHVKNSLINHCLKENSHSRTIVTIPDDKQNSFLVGVTAKTKNSEIIKVIYDELNKKISSETILDFNKANEDKEKQLINEIYAIYPRNTTDFFINVLNSTTKKHELKLFTESKPNEFSNISCVDSDNIFDIINYKNNNEIINFIDNHSIKTIDINKNSISNEIKITENNNEIPIKISSDNSALDENLIGCGIGKDVYITDYKSKKPSIKINDVHDNSVLCFQFDPVSPFNFCTSGTDYSLKFWDYRKPNIEYGGIYNNSHWIWSFKYNKNYSNIMITASSSSLVRGIVFDKYRDTDLKNNKEGENIAGISSSLATLGKYSSDKNVKQYTFIDYFEFEDSVYAIDWLKNDSWLFVATSFNSYFHVNAIPEDIKYKIML